MVYFLYHENLQTDISIYNTTIQCPPKPIHNFLLLPFTIIVAGGIFVVAVVTSVVMVSAGVVVLPLVVVSAGVVVTEVVVISGVVVIMEVVVIMVVVVAGVVVVAW